MSEIKTYSEMNEKLVGLLRVSDKFESQYAAKRIEELGHEKEKLIEALMSMCNQYLSTGHDSDLLTHDFMSAGEESLELLEQLGFAETGDAGVTYRLKVKP